MTHFWKFYCYFYLTTLIRESSTNKNNYVRVKIQHDRGKNGLIWRVIYKNDQNTLFLHPSDRSFQRLFIFAEHVCDVIMTSYYNVNIIIWRSEPWSYKKRQTIQRKSTFALTLVPFFPARWRHNRLFYPRFFQNMYNWSTNGSWNFRNAAFHSL